jgi:hypothetical protein
VSRLDWHCDKLWSCCGLFSADDSKFALDYLYAAQFSQHGYWSRIWCKALQCFQMVLKPSLYCRIILQ